MTITLYNTLTRRKEAFEPIDPANVRLYVCGPTVYDYAHIGNARPAIVFDVLFRLLRHAYGPEHVTYVRNITDVDDKINARAARDYPGEDPLGAIARLTRETARQYHEDVAALGTLPPTHEPRATEHIEVMKGLIEQLIAAGHAYVAEDHVLFDVPSMRDYGELSGRSLEEMEAGARVDVAPYKKDPMDFVLWKPSKAGEPAWPSPAGIGTPGRPGWHIECSAMAKAHLGEVFDIHGGGIDLVFPHHENEVAQSRCAHASAVMANYWMHNGFLQVEGEKMSKSLGNFITIHELLAERKFGDQPWHGKVLRLAMLQTQYRQPIDWTVDRLTQARAFLFELADTLVGAPRDGTPAEDFLAALADDLNTPAALSILHGQFKSARKGSAEALAKVAAAVRFLNIWDGETRAELAVGFEAPKVDAAEIESLIAQRLAARRARDFKEADRIRDVLAAKGIRLKDGPDGTTWEIAG
ncbi:MAG: cysteine--tRNA ligase [Hyphomicrobiaceae bacterium]